MILDEKLEFCDATDVSAAAGTAVAGDVIDLDNLGRELIDTLYLVITVSTAFASGGSATVDFRLSSDSTANLATSATDHWTSGATAIASLTAGKTYIVPLPSNLGASYERYLGIRVVTATATTTAGSINAFLTNDVQRWKAYADAEN